MSEPFIGTVRAFGFSFPPQGWALCNGQLLAVSQNDVLFSLIGTTYGGNGVTTFGLPDLRGRTSLHFGTGPGLTPRSIGQRAGSEAVVLTLQELASHRHSVVGNSAEAASSSPGGNVPAVTSSPIYSAFADAPLSAGMIGQTGGGGSHNNMQPYLVINWCIALVGVEPS